MRLRKALKLRLHYSFTMLAKEIAAQSASSVRRPGIGRRRVHRRKRWRGGRAVEEGRLQGCVHPDRRLERAE
jgi:hypothetical protein